MSERGGEGGETIVVRATINLPGVKRGEIILADAESEYVQQCLAASYLVPVGNHAAGGHE